MDKFGAKYRIPTARLSTWDYGANAGYFITICTARHAREFGEINFGVMSTSPLGQAAVDCWTEIPNHFPIVVLDEFVVMPNHVHGILIINKNDPPPTSVETQNLASLQNSQNLASLQNSQNLASLRGGNQFGPQSQNLASIVRGYKIDVTKFTRLHNIQFAWQPRYHDHIIRDVEDCDRIRQYIQTNPYRWTEDTYYLPAA